MLTLVLRLYLPAVPVPRLKVVWIRSPSLLNLATSSLEYLSVAAIAANQFFKSLQPGSRLSARVHLQLGCHLSRVDVATISVLSLLYIYSTVHQTLRALFLWVAATLGCTTQHCRRPVWLKVEWSPKRKASRGTRAPSFTRSKVHHVDARHVDLLAHLLVSGCLAVRTAKLTGTCLRKLPVLPILLLVPVFGVWTPAGGGWESSRTPSCYAALPILRGFYSAQFPLAARKIGSSRRARIWRQNHLALTNVRQTGSGNIK